MNAVYERDISVHSFIRKKKISVLQGFSFIWAVRLIVVSCPDR